MSSQSILKKLPSNVKQTHTIASDVCDATSGLNIVNIPQINRTIYINTYENKQY